MILNHTLLYILSFSDLDLEFSQTFVVDLYEMDIYMLFDEIKSLTVASLP